MKKLLTLSALSLVLSFGAAHAADAPAKAAAAAPAAAAPAAPAAEPTKQQSKMGTCNKEAGDMKGDERKAFMSECLKK